MHTQAPRLSHLTSNPGDVGSNLSRQTQVFGNQHCIKITSRHKKRSNIEDVVEFKMV